MKETEGENYRKRDRLKLIRFTENYNTNEYMSYKNYLLICTFHGITLPSIPAVVKSVETPDELGTT